MPDFDYALSRQLMFKYFGENVFHQALAHANRLLRKNKDDLDAMRIAGLSYCRAGRHDEGMKLLNKCLDRTPLKGYMHAEIGSMLSQRGKYDEAVDHFQKALKFNPDFMPAIFGIAYVHERRNDHDAVRSLIKPYIDSGREPVGISVVYGRLLLAEKRYGECITLAERHLASPAIANDDRHFLCEVVAKAYEKEGHIDKAFLAFKRSNDLKAVPFNEAAYNDTIETLMATYSKRNLQQLPKCRWKSELPVFIASMPRSGSTLTEQIIHSHPQAFGAGEITDVMRLIGDLPKKLDSFQAYPACLGDFTAEKADEFGKAYLDDLKEMAPRSALRVANKHLENYKVLGLVQLLWPGARVVHVKRDPLDNCFSCFMAQLGPTAMPWCTDLRNLGIAYRQYERLMAHWHEVLEIPILDVQYEDLVEDTEGGIRRMIDFLGLPWNDRCLRYWEADRDVLTLSYDQVNKPIYKSAVKRWEKYEAFLGPLREVLEGPAPWAA